MLPPSNVSEEEAVSVRCTYNVLVLIAYYLGCLWNEKNHKENEALLRAMADRATQASRCVFGLLPSLLFPLSLPTPSLSLDLVPCICLSQCLSLSCYFRLSLRFSPSPLPLLLLSLSVCLSICAPLPLSSLIRHLPAPSVYVSV